MPKFWKGDDVKHINELRNKLECLQNANNEIVREIWQITIELGKAPNQQLQHKKEKLEKDLAKKHYPEQIEEIKEQIESLEIKVYGSSKIRSSSPSAQISNTGS